MNRNKETKITNLSLNQYLLAKKEGTNLRNEG